MIWTASPSHRAGCGDAPDVASGKQLLKLILQGWAVAGAAASAQTGCCCRHQLRNRVASAGARKPPTTVCAHTGCPLAPGWPRKVGLKPRSRGVGWRRDPALSGAPSCKQPEERCSGLSCPACEVGVGMGLHRELRGESGRETGSLSARRALGSTPGGGE